MTEEVQPTPGTLGKRRDFLEIENENRRLYDVLTDAQTVLQAESNKSVALVDLLAQIDATIAPRA